MTEELLSREESSIQKVTPSQLVAPASPTFLRTDVTAANLVALSLVASEVAKAHGESILVLDQGRHVVAANSMAERAFGAAPGALVGSQIETLIPLGIASDQGFDIAPGDLPIPVEGCRLDGREFAALARLYRFEEPSGLVGLSLVDITDEGVLQRGLVRSVSVAGALLRHLAVGIVVQSAGGAIIEANASAEKILGLTRDQLIGRTSVDPRWRAVRKDGTPFPGADHPAIRALRSGGVQRDLIGVYKPDGTLTWIEVEASRLIETQNTPVYSAFVDVTEVVGAERQMAMALRRQEAMGSLSSEAVLILDAGFVIRSVSSNAARLLGCTPPDLLGKPFSDLVESPQSSALQASLGELLAYPGARGRWDVNLRLASGHVRTFDGSGMNMLADDTVNGLLINLRDIHDQRVAEAALRSANEELEHRLSELSADRAFDAGLSRVADLLQQCTTPEEACDVLWASLPTLIPGFDMVLYFEDSEHVEFVRHRATSDANVFLPAEACWALRTHRAHISDGIVKLRCDHVGQGGTHTACLPLILNSRI
jgi:PAS domain S-box-containing protein